MRIGVVGLLFVSWSVFAAENAMTYESARMVWEQNRGKKEYQAYAMEFSQFNNHFHLDEKDGCYALGKDPVELMLIITYRAGQRFARIDKVLTDVQEGL